MSFDKHLYVWQPPRRIPAHSRIVEEVYQSTSHAGGGGYRDEYKLQVDERRSNSAATSRPTGAGGGGSRAPVYPTSNHNGTIRCPCKDNRDSGLMIQCEVCPKRP
eukprot:1073519-Pyramimonas_sp.AAC.1